MPSPPDVAVSGLSKWENPPYNDEKSHSQREYVHLSSLVVLALFYFRRHVSWSSDMSAQVFVILITSKAKVD